MAPWTSKKREKAIPPPLAPKSAPETLPSFPFESEFSHHRPSDLSGSTCAASLSYDSTLDGESADSHVPTPFQRVPGEKDGKGGRGIMGLFTRSRSNSRVDKSAKTQLDQKTALLPPLPTTFSPPPVEPDAPTGQYPAKKDRLAPALPIFNDGNHLRRSSQDDAFASFAQEEGIASIPPTLLRSSRPPPAPLRRASHILFPLPTLPSSPISRRQSHQLVLELLPSLSHAQRHPRVEMNTVRTRSDRRSQRNRCGQRNRTSLSRPRESKPRRAPSSLGQELKGRR